LHLKIDFSLRIFQPTDGSNRTVRAGAHIIAGVSLSSSLHSSLPARQNRRGFHVGEQEQANNAPGHFRHRDLFWLHEGGRTAAFLSTVLAPPSPSIQVFFLSHSKSVNKSSTCVSATRSVCGVLCTRRPSALAIARLCQPVVALTKTHAWICIPCRIATKPEFGVSFFFFFFL
jgi:hypothetical protein